VARVGTREPPPPPPAQGRGHRLSDGRPGSVHPVSESPPREAQAGSLADPNPHADRKLSSSAGRPAENDRATGSPGSARPLSKRPG
jgi:hypothetical protein